MRSPAFHTRMGLLALAAMLLLALVPTMGRLAASERDSGEGLWVQMCTMAGLELVNLAPPGAATPTPEPGGDGGHPSQGECPYCPLLGTLAALLLSLALVFPPLANERRPFANFLLPRPRRHPCGLGSRGPPIVL